MYSLADENVVTRGSQKSNSVSYNERSTRLAKSKQEPQEMMFWKNTMHSNFHILPVRDYIAIL